MQLPRITYTCCHITYNSYIDTEYFKAFKHKPDNDKYTYGITVRLICKNNNCIMSFTFCFNDKNEIIETRKIKGKKYLLKLQQLYIEEIPLKKEENKVPKTSKEDDWVYTKGSKNGNSGLVYKFKTNKKIKKEFSPIKESNDITNRNSKKT